jgi:hypothetical protein
MYPQHYVFMQGPKPPRDSSDAQDGARREDASADAKTSGAQGGADPTKSERARREGSPGTSTASDPRDLRLPSDVIKRLRDTVFSFDTFFVTGVENYDADGVLFKGNLRGAPEKSFQKLESRLKVCIIGCFLPSFCQSIQKCGPIVLSWTAGSPFCMESLHLCALHPWPLTGS